MQRETIFYISDMKWFTHAGGKYADKFQAMQAHINYVNTSKDFSFGLGDSKMVFERMKLANKRSNSRIGFSFIFALPNDLNDTQTKEWIERIRDIIATKFGMNKEDIYIGLHDATGISGTQNKHIHIIGANLTKDGKALRVDKNTLSDLNKTLEDMILAHGYIIKKDGEESIGHIGTRLRYDDKLRQDYQAYVETKQVYRQMYKELQKKKKQEEERQKQEEERKREEARKKRQEWIEKNLFILQDNISKLGKRITKYLATDETLNNLYKEFETKTRAEIKSLKETGKADVKGYNDIYMRLTKALQEAEKKEKEAGKKQQQTQKPADKPNQPPKQTEEIKSQPKTETKPAQPIQPKPQEPIQKTAQPKFQEQKPTIEPAQQPPKQPKQEQKPAAPEPQPTIKTTQTQPQAQKPSTELPKQAMSKPQPTQLQKQQPIQKTEPKQEQKPTQKSEAQKSEPKPQPKREKPKTEEVKTQQIETPKIESEPKPVEPEKIETPPQSEIKPEQTIETKPEQQPRKHRYILLYEDENDADWYWENYIVNNIDENTNVETYSLPERLTEDHMNRLKRIASKGHRIDLLISNAQYFYANYDVLDKLKDYINIMVIEKPEQGQRQKNQDREEQEQDRGYHRPMM